MGYALELKQVTKRYGDYALENVNLALPRGCIMGLIGENGAGKSTTIRSIIGAVRPDAGEIRVLGCDNRSGEFLAVKQELGVVLDEACFPDGLTPRQVCRMMRDIYENWEEEAFFGYLKRFDLPADKMFREFSRGMKMKLSLAAALSHRAKLLILDEPTNGLDPIARDDILDVFMEFTRSEEHSILISSHIISDLEKICDYIVYLHEGKVVFDEEKDALLDKYAVYGADERQLAELDKGAVVRILRREYGVDILAKKEKMPQGFGFRPACLDDIMLFFAKGERI